MSVKISPLLICTLSLLLSACSGSASAPDSAEDAKLSAEVDKMFRDYQTGSDQFTAGQRLTLSDAGPERLSSLK
jgi:colicin import membrane protein